MNSFVKYGLIMFGVGLLGAALLPVFQPIFHLIDYIALAILIFGVVKFSDSRNQDSSSNKDKAFSDGYKYSFSNSGTGIALSPEQKIIKLKDKRNVKEYPFSDVRKWSTNISTGGQVMGSGHYIGHNIAVNRKNKIESGLFIQVKDIDNPEWRVAMLNKKEQSRWMEILQQTLNES